MRFLVAVAACAVVILLAYSLRRTRVERGASSAPPGPVLAPDVLEPSAQVPQQVAAPSAPKPEEVRVSGRVLDQMGTGVKGALVWAETRVEVNRAGKTALVVQRTGSEPTGADGGFALVVAQAGVEYTFRAEAQGYFPGQVVFFVPARGAQNVEIVLHQGASISGRVLDLGRNPMQHVWVGAQDGSKRLFRTKKSTGPDGQYEITTLPAGEYSLGALYDPRGKPRERIGFFVGKEPAEPLAEVTLRAGEARAGVELIIPWVPGPAVSGRVRDSNGRPVADAVVSALVGTLCGYAEEKTDAQGRFVIRYLESSPAGASPDVVALMAECPGYERATVEGVPVPSKDVEIILMPARRGRIEGTVRDAISGKPIKGAGIFLAGVDAEWGEYVPVERGRTRYVDRFTDASGFFEIEGVPAGLAGLIVRADGYGIYTRSGIGVRADEIARVDLCVEPAGCLRVAVDYVGLMEGLEPGRALVCWRADGDARGPILDRYELSDLARADPAGPLRPEPEGTYELSLAPGTYHAVIAAWSPGEVLAVPPELQGRVWSTTYQHRLIQVESGLTSTWSAEVGGTGTLRGDAFFPDVGIKDAVWLFLARGGDVSSLLKPMDPRFTGDERFACYASHFDVLVATRIRTTRYYLPCLSPGEYTLVVVLGTGDNLREMLMQQQFTIGENEDKVINLP